jgi:deoxycytidine triphosphate deaminase
MANEKANESLFSDPISPSGVLTDKEIEDYVNRGQLIVSTTFRKNCLEASSYDVRVGLRGIMGGVGTEIDLKNNVMELSPGAYAGVISYEKFNLSLAVSARIGSKRALSYDGVILLTGSVVDPGYQGHLLFGLYNASQRKVIIRIEKKIANIVFERLSRNAEKAPPLNPDLLNGNFPDTFLERMANMDVLPWMQISERVKQIENITKDIIDLKKRYEDVLQPIKELTVNVSSLSKDVESLSSSTKDLSKDLDRINALVKENCEHISTLTSTLTMVSAQHQGIQTLISGINEEHKSQKDKIFSLTTDFGRYKIISYVFWAVVLLVAGALLPKLIEKVFH